MPNGDSIPAKGGPQSGPLFRTTDRPPLSGGRFIASGPISNPDRLLCSQPLWSSYSRKTYDRRRPIRHRVPYARIPHSSLRQPSRHPRDIRAQGLRDSSGIRHTAGPPDFDWISTAGFRRRCTYILLRSFPILRICLPTSSARRSSGRKGNAAPPNPGKSCPPPNLCSSAGSPFVCGTDRGATAGSRGMRGTQP